MTSIRSLSFIPGTIFSVPSDADGIIYEVGTGGAIQADGMITMSLTQALEAFSDSELKIIIAPRVKSLMPVRFYGAGNNGNWVVRARLSDGGGEIFLGNAAGYSLAQAQSAMHNTRHNLADYRPIPVGVTVKA